MRSKKLKLFDILMPKENCWKVINILGNLNSIHFKNLNENEVLNNQISELKRQEDCINKINEIQIAIKNNKINIDDNFDLDKINEIIKNNSLNLNIIEDKNFEKAEKKINEYNNKIRSNEININNLKDKILDLYKNSRLLFILKKNLKENLRLYTNPKNSINYLTGIIKNSEFLRFQKIIFRITRGNVLLLNFPITHDKTNLLFDIEKDDDENIIFLVFKNKKFKNILERLFINFNIKNRILPNKIDEFIDETEIKLKELEILYKETKNNLLDYLLELSSPKNDSKISVLTEWKFIIVKEKIINLQINKMKIKNSLLYGKFWIPKSKVGRLESEIEKLKKENNFEGIILKENPNLLNPPTLILNNKFTKGFQIVVDTYGVPNYSEINPGYFTIITFPFLFGVMFGDIFHGFLLTVLGYYLIKYSEQLKKINRNFDLIKYFIFMMGIFSFYNGFIYNDFTSIYPSLFGSCYNKNFQNKGCVYIFGIDPIWGNAKNDVEFINSYKMKISIIIGVIHMTWGIILKGINCLKNKDLISFFFEFIPQIIFFLSIFGYMVLIIIAKWLFKWDPYSSSAPSIISLFINFHENPNIGLIGNYIFQGSLQRFLMIISIISIPLMLLPKPIINYYRNKKKNNFNTISLEANSNLFENSDENFKVVKEEENFSEMFIHQTIETIEFILGSVSNTASYLRLWALSLAHAQLSKVFFELLLQNSIIKAKSIFMGVFSSSIIFIFFLNVTFLVLMFMDVLECFLHALRLHWVEFQNKFFKGDGYKFIALDFNEEFKNVLLEK